MLPIITVSSLTSHWSPYIVQADMIAWLYNKRVVCDRAMYKNNLYQIILALKPNKKIYKTSKFSGSLGNCSKGGHNLCFYTTKRLDLPVIHKNILLPQVTDRCHADAEVTLWKKMCQGYKGISCVIEKSQLLITTCYINPKNNRQNPITVTYSSTCPHISMT